MAKQTIRADRIAALREQQKELAQRLTRLEAKERTEKRKMDTRRKIVVGGAVIALMEKDPTFAKPLAQMLSASVGRQQDRAVIADLLGEGTEPKKAAPDEPARP